MVKKRHIVSKKNPDKSYENGTTTTPTPVLGKNENCQRRPGSLQLRSQTGSKTEDKEIEPQKVQGKEKLHIILPLWYLMGHVQNLGINKKSTNLDLSP